MLVTMKDLTGNQIGEVNLDDSVFSAPVNKTLMHQALVRQLANARLGTHKTKGRSEVRGGGRKPWRQKGTGRARQGSTRAPNWVGGGTVFGPQPRKYTKSMPRKMRRSALRSALSVKATAGQIVIVDNLTMETPKTKQMVRILSALDVAHETVLLVMAERDMALVRSANNLPQVKTLNAAYLNIRDLLGYDTVVVSSDAVAYIEAWLSVDGYTGHDELIDEPEEASDVTDTIDNDSEGIEEPVSSMEDGEPSDEPDGEPSAAKSEDHEASNDNSSTSAEE
ncbi:MAG: 50S ribosomal protein L4 [Chloroflexota bacterium]